MEVRDTRRDGHPAIATPENEQEQLAYALDNSESDATPGQYPKISNSEAYPDTGNSLPRNPKPKRQAYLRAQENMKTWMNEINDSEL